jgi:hypothetical protein
MIEEPLAGRLLRFRLLFLPRDDPLGLAFAPAHARAPATPNNKPSRFLSCPSFSRRCALVRPLCPCVLSHAYQKTNFK